MSTTGPWLVFEPAVCRIKSDTPQVDPAVMIAPLFGW